MPHVVQTIAQLGGVGIVTATTMLYAASYKPYQAHSCPDELSRLGKQVAANVGRHRDTTEWDCCEMVVSKPREGHYDALSLTQAFFGGRMFTPELMVLKRMTRNVNDEAIIWQPLLSRTQWAQGKRVANLFVIERITASSDSFVDRVEVLHLGARMHNTLTLDATLLDDDNMIRYRAAYSNVDPQSDLPISRVALFLHRLYARILFQDAVRQLPL